MVEANEVNGGSIFAAVRFAIIPSVSLHEQHANTLAIHLEGRGAQYVPLNEHGRVNDVNSCTHILSTTADFPDYDAAVDQYIPVVKPEWADHSLVKQKLLNTKGYSPDPKLFFSDVAITCADDIPEGDKEAITGGVLAMGGTCLDALSVSITHVVALTQDTLKCKVVRKKNLKCKVVLPHWFDDCFKLGKKIDEKPYMLPDPEILNPYHAGPVSGHKKNQDAFMPLTMTGSDGLPDSVVPPSPSSDRVNLDCFRDQTVKLSEDLDIGRRLRGILEGLIQSGRGSVTESIAEADIYVCQYRDGQDYISASRAGKTVGTLTWIYYMITFNTWTNPMRRLLHYPIPRHGMEGFKGLRITISNYTGDARTYLQKLIEASGAEYTRSLDEKNTHLITAHASSTKYEAAKEWNVNVVNHLWLEEGYAKCQAQTLTNHRYTHFPKHTNLGEVVGQTEIDRDTMKKRFSRLSVLESSEGSKTASIAPSDQSSSTNTNAGIEYSAWMRGTNLSDSDDSEVEGAEPSPLAGKKQPSSFQTLSDPTVAEDAQLGSPHWNGKSAENGIAPDKENETPKRYGNRGAKERAVSKMHDLAPDIALYQKEMKRKGGVIHGGSRNGSAEDNKKKGEAGRPGKRLLEENDDDDEEEEEEEEEEQEKGLALVTAKGQGKPKKRKSNQFPPIDHRMLLTGTKDDVKNDEKTQLRSMGIIMTDNPANATILCAPKVMRTKKFVAALACGPLVVKTSFLDYCLTHDSPPRAAEYALGNDIKTMETFGIKISETIKRAKINKRHLLRGWTIFCTEGVKGGFETFRDIVEINGGTCLKWKGRSTVRVTNRKMSADEDEDLETGEESQNQGGENEKDYLYLISGESNEEMGLWQKFRLWAFDNELLPRIVTPDWLLGCAMAQQIEWNEDYELGTDEV